ncbi:MAG: GldG family protein [Deltaproteobacteria bacterium]|nr:GldG family protein [Deltaproteobacteria bacterium]
MDKLQRYGWTLGVAGLLGVVVAGSLWFLFKEATQSVIIAASVATALLGTWAYVDRQALAGTLASRGFRYGSGSATLVGMVGAIALFGFVLSKNHDHRWDLTQEQRFTLSEQSLQVARGLEGVELIAFFQGGSAEERRFRDLSEGLRLANPSLQVRVVDPFRDAALARQFAVTSAYGTVVLKRGEASQRLESDFSEDAVVAALIRLQSDEKHRVCWSTGHGEFDIADDYTPGGYGTVGAKLGGLNYAVTPYRLLQGALGDHCDAVVVMGPQEELLPVEEEQLAVFLAQGGRVLVGLEPGDAPGFSSALARYGVVVGDDLVLDADIAARAAGLDDPTALLLDQRNRAPHPILEAFRGDLLLQLTRSVSFLDGTPGMAGSEIVRTGPSAWAETQWREAAETDALGPDPSVDIVGDVPLMVVAEVTDGGALGVGEQHAPDGAAPAAEVPAPLEGLTAPLDLSDRSAAVPADFSPVAGGRLVVIGDAGFASNRFIAAGSNQDLFFNSLAWLVDEADQLGERPEVLGGDMLEMNILEEALLWLVSLFLVPGLAAIMALVILVRRRFQ